MTYVIAEPCIDVLDRACVQECPVDCACEPVCPVEAIFYEDDVPDRWTVFTDDNARHFTDPRPGRDHPVESPGGAGKIGRIGATHR